MKSLKESLGEHSGKLPQTEDILWTTLRQSDYSNLNTVEKVVYKWDDLCLQLTRVLKRQ